MQQGLSLQLAGLDAAELYNAVDGGGIFDQAVITDDLDALSGRFFKHRAELRAVNRANDDHFDAVLHHGLNLLLLLGNLVVSVLNDGLKSCCFKLRFEHVIRFRPVLCAKPGQRDTDGCVGFKSFSDSAGTKHQHRHEERHCNEH